MLRRAPAGYKSSDQNPTSATSGGFGIISKPFKAPTPLAAKRHVDLPGRKRKAVNYKDAGGDKDDAGDENARPDEGGPSKKVKYAMGNKEYGDDGVLGGLGAVCMRKFPVFAVKEKTATFGKM